MHAFLGPGGHADRHSPLCPSGCPALLCADPAGELYTALGFSPGFAPDAPVSAYAKLLPMLAGIGSPGTIQEVCLVGGGSCLGVALLAPPALLYAQLHCWPCPLFGRAGAEGIRGRPLKRTPQNGHLKRSPHPPHPPPVAGAEGLCGRPLSQACLLRGTQPVW